MREKNKRAEKIVLSEMKELKRKGGTRRKERRRGQPKWEAEERRG